MTGSLENLSPENHVILIWDGSRLDSMKSTATRAVCDFAGRGGRVIVLSTSSWTWKGLCDVAVADHPRFSRVFPASGTRNPMLEGIEPAWLMRWNGLPGTVATGRIEIPSQDGIQKILWAKDPSSIVAAELPANSGGGRITYTQLDLQRRVNRSSLYYDPVAERILINLLNLPVQDTGP
jgi:hypothetical protein